MKKRDPFYYAILIALFASHLTPAFNLRCLFGAGDLAPEVSQDGIVSQHWKVVSRTEDPLVPEGGKLQVLTTSLAETNFESGLVRDFCATPLGKKLGYDLLPGGKVQVPNLQSINGRIKKLREMKDPDAPVFSLWEDTSPAGAEAVEFCRNYVDRKVPYSRKGVKYNFSLVLHDIMAHAPGYFVIPEAVFQVSKSRLDLQLALHDSPVLSKNELFMSFISHALQQEMETIDPASYRIPQIFPAKSALSQKNKTDVLFVSFKEIGGYGSKDLGDLILNYGTAFHLTDPELAELKAITAKFQSSGLSLTQLMDLAKKTQERFGR